MEQSRWKSPVLWGTTVANLAVIVGILAPAFDVQPYVKIIGIVIVMLTQFGIFNSPTTKKGF